MSRPLDFEDYRRVFKFWICIIDLYCNYINNNACISVYSLYVSYSSTYMYNPESAAGSECDQGSEYDTAVSMLLSETRLDTRDPSALALPAPYTTFFDR